MEKETREEREMPIDVMPAVKSLSEGFSIQAKLGNRNWFLILVFSVIFLLPNSRNLEKNTVTFPFNLGTIDIGYIDICSFVVFIILSVSYSSARAASLLTYKLAHDVIDRIQNSRNRYFQRRYFDMLHAATLFRVGPLGNLLNLNSSRHSKFLSFIRYSYYFVLKIFGILVLNGLPFLALSISANRLMKNYENFDIIVASIGLISIIGFIPLVQVTVVDMRHTLFAAKRISRPFELI